MKKLNINLKNPNDYNRAIQFLELANVELGTECRERDLTVAMIEVVHIYDYTCPHCGEEYTELGEELKTHYHPETGMIHCKCGKELKPLIQYSETVLPQVIKPQEEEEVIRLSINIDDYNRVHELLRLAGIEAYDLEHIEQVVVYVNHAYNFECPICGEYHKYPAYEHEGFYVEYNLEEKQIHCKYCEQNFKAKFKTNEDNVFE